MGEDGCRQCQQPDEGFYLNTCTKVKFLHISKILLSFLKSVAYNQKTMKTIILALFIFGGIWAVQAQEPKDKHGAWKVNKEFDENGNLIRYDSVYSWSADGNTKPYDPEMLDSLFGQIPKFLDPIGKDMAEFFDNDPFFSQIFGSKGNPNLYSEPFTMEEIEEMLRNDSLRVDEADVDQLLDEMERLRKEFLRQLRGQPKIPEEKRDSMR